MKTGIWLVLVMAVGLVGGVLFSGCETAKGVSGLPVSPDSATLSGTNVSVTITAMVQSDLALPLQWSESAPSLGTLLASGSNAVYTAALNASGTQLVTGAQVVTVKDQYGNEGSCSIVQM